MRTSAPAPAFIARAFIVGNLRRAREAGKDEFRAEIEAAGFRFVDYFLRFTRD